MSASADKSAALPAVAARRTRRRWMLPAPRWALSVSWPLARWGGGSLLILAESHCLWHRLHGCWWRWSAGIYVGMCVARAEYQNSPSALVRFKCLSHLIRRDAKTDVLGT